MHSPLKFPGLDLILTPVPSVTSRMWSVADLDGNKLGVVHRVRENPGTRKERTRWAATAVCGAVRHHLMTRRAAVEFLIEKAGTK